MASDLDNVPGDIWQRLVARDGAWRTPVLATARPDGGADARTVVLREAEPVARELVFFSDARAGKVAQLDAEPRACLVVYDDQRRLQARLYGDARRELDVMMLDAWWERLEAQQRRLYAAGVIAEPRSGKEKGRENFAAFRVVVDRFHCLWINDVINEAAVFEWRDRRWQARAVRA